MQLLHNISMYISIYKKNVELHLLLILAIDSVIYSFYVTILLCKKAPVFD